MRILRENGDLMEYTTLCYIEKDNKYLMLYRNKKKTDLNKGKWLGIGGHIEEGEDPNQCLLREAKEETGLTLLNYKLRGKLHFYIDDIYEVSYLYTCDEFMGDLIECDEGILEWVDKTKILELNLWQGDYLFLKKLIKDEPYFEMKLVYLHDQLIDWSFL